jgi:prevent-host-death family protein
LTASRQAGEDSPHSQKGGDAMNTVSTFEANEAKNKFSELIDAAGVGEPQLITKNGVGTAVLISYDDYRRLTARSKPLTEFLLESPLKGSGIDLDRSKADGGRATLDFSAEAE